MSEWTATIDRLPPKEMDVLALVEGRVFMMQRYGKSWYYDGDLWDGEKPSHWIEIPELPQ